MPNFRGFVHHGPTGDLPPTTPRPIATPDRRSASQATSSSPYPWTPTPDPDGLRGRSVYSWPPPPSFSSPYMPSPPQRSPPLDPALPAADEVVNTVEEPENKPVKPAKPAKSAKEKSKQRIRLSYEDRTTMVRICCNHRQMYISRQLERKKFWDTVTLSFNRHQLEHGSALFKSVREKMPVLLKEYRIFLALYGTGKSIDGDAEYTLAIRNWHLHVEAVEAELADAKKTQTEIEEEQAEAEAIKESMLLSLSDRVKQRHERAKEKEASEASSRASSSDATSADDDDAEDTTTTPATPAADAVDLTQTPAPTQPAKRKKKKEMKEPRETASAKRRRLRAEQIAADAAALQQGDDRFLTILSRVVDANTSASPAEGSSRNGANEEAMEQLAKQINQIETNNAELKKAVKATESAVEEVKGNVGSILSILQEMSKQQ